VGRVVKPHGLKGEVVVETFTEDPRRFEAGSALAVNRPGATSDKLTVATSRPDRGRLLVRFEEISDRDAAEAIRGSQFFVSASELSHLDEDSFWEHELVGSSVVARDGRLIGAITRVLPRVEQDLWEVDSDGALILIPASKEIVVSVDLAKREVVIDPPPGLVDEDAV
jgi:16S rRNA processing protein RimM